MSDPEADCYVVIGRYSDGSGISDSALLFWSRQDAESFIKSATDVFGGGYRDAIILPAKDMEKE